MPGRRRRVRYVRCPPARLAVVAVLACLVLLGPATLALGHESDALLELDPPTVAPAGGVVVTAHGLDRSVTMRLTLEGTETRVDLGDVEVDAAGHFERLVALPPAVVPGVYGVKVSVATELVVSSVLVIDAAAGPGHPIDRGPPTGPVLIIAIAGAALLLAGLRIGARVRGAGRPVA